MLTETVWIVISCHMSLYKLCKNVSALSIPPVFESCFSSFQISFSTVFQISSFGNEMDYIICVYLFPSEILKWECSYRHVQQTIKSMNIGNLRIKKNQTIVANRTLSDNNNLRNEAILGK